MKKISILKTLCVGVVALLSLQTFALWEYEWQAGNGKRYDSFSEAEQNTSAGQTIKYVGEKDREGLIAEWDFSVNKDIVLDFNGKALAELRGKLSSDVDDMNIINNGEGTLTLRNIILKQPRDKNEGDKRRYANISFCNGKFILDNAYVWGWGTGEDELYVHSYDGASLTVVNSGSGMTFDGCNMYACHFAKGEGCSLNITGGDFLFDPSAFVDKKAYEVVDVGGWCKYRVQAKTVPEVKDDKGTLDIPDGSEEATLKPNDGVVEVEISNIGDLTLIVPPQIQKITGVKAGKVKVMADEDTNSGTRKVDITAAFTITDGNDGVTIELNLEASVEIDDGNGGAKELIPVMPVMATKAGTAVENTPFVVDGGTVKIGAKAIPGLTYKLLGGIEFGGITNFVSSLVAREPRIVLDANKGDEPFELFQLSVDR